MDKIHTQPINSTHLWPPPWLIQSDGGTCCLVTNNALLLSNPKSILHDNIGGAGSGITPCIAEDTNCILAEDGSLIPVHMCYSPEATETLISPTDAVNTSKGLCTSWTQILHITTGEGSLDFWSWSGLIHHHVPLIMKNQLWFFKDATLSPNVNHHSTNNAANDVHGVASYELWHDWLGHPNHGMMFW